MSSSIFSSCCDGFQSVENSETYASKISRNIYKKNKTCNIVTSPKSSLKSQNNNKTIKSPEDSVRQQNLLLTSTVNVAQFSKTQNFAKRIQTNKPEVSFLKVPYVQNVVYLNRTRPNLLTPSPIKQAIPSRTVHIQKVNFSYNNSKNKEPFPKQPTTSPFTHITVPSFRQKLTPRTLQKVEPINKDKGKLIQSQVISQLPKEIVMNQGQSVKSNLPFQQILQLENRNSLPINILRAESKQQKQKDRKQVMENRKTAPQGLVFDKYLFGGSKFTVLSQEQLEQANEQKSLRLEQSAILVNVFNPTNSQMKNWQVKKSKVSQISHLYSSRK